MRKKKKEKKKEAHGRHNLLHPAGALPVGPRHTAPPRPQRHVWSLGCTIWEAVRCSVTWTSSPLQTSAWSLDVYAGGGCCRTLPGTQYPSLFWGVVPFVPAHTNPRRRGSVIGRFAAEAAETRRRCSHGSLMQLALASLKTGTNSTDRNWTVPALCVSLPCNRCPVHGVSLCVGACLIPPILAIRVSLLERCWCNDVAGRIGIAELRDETAEWRRRHAFAVPS